MKKNLNARKAQFLKLNRETLIHLEKSLEIVGGGSGADGQVFSVKFCTELGCTTSGG